MTRILTALFVAAVLCAATPASADDEPASLEAYLQELMRSNRLIAGRVDSRFVGPGGRR